MHGSDAPRPRVRSGTRVRASWRPATGAFIGMCFLAVLVLESCAGPGDEPVSFVRDCAGGWTRSGDPNLPLLSFAATSTHRAANRSATTGVSASFPQRVLCRHIAILDDGGAALNRYAALAMQQELLALPFVDRVDYYPAGLAPTPGDRVADLIVRIAPSRFDTFWLPCWYSCSLRVAVDTTLSPSMVRRARPDHWSEPTPWLLLDWNVSEGQDVRILGPSTHKVREVGDVLGAGLGAELAGILREKVDEHGLVARLPNYAYGSYRDADSASTPVLQRHGIRKLIDGAGPFHHHLSVWRFEAPGPQGTLLERVAGEMEDAGWTMIPASATERDERQFVRGTQRIAVGVLETPDSASLASLLGGALSREDESAESEPAAEWGSYYVHYSEEFDDAEYAAVFARLFDDKKYSLEDLLPFDALVKRSARDVWNRFVERLAEQRPASARTHAYLARTYQKDGRREAARERLQMAATLQRARHVDALDDTLEEIASDLGAQELLNHGGPAVYRALGFIELDARSMEVATQIGLDEPAFAFFEGAFGVMAVGVEFRRSGPGANGALDVHTYSPSIVSRKTVDEDPANDFVAYEGAWPVWENASRAHHTAWYEVRRVGRDRFAVRFRVEADAD